MNEIATLINFLLHEELNVVEKLFITHIKPLFEIINLFKQLDFEINPLVIITVYNTIFDDIVEIRVVIPQIVELLLCQFCEDAVVHALNSRCSRTIEN